MIETVLGLTTRHSRTVVLLALLTLLLLVGAAGEVAAHGPCHANPGDIPEIVCADLPSKDAPRN